MLDNPFLFLLLVCGTPIFTHLFAFAAGWWFHSRGYTISRRAGARGRTEPEGVGYAPPPAPPIPEHLQGRRIPTAQHTPILDRMARR